MYAMWMDVLMQTRVFVVLGIEYFMRTLKIKVCFSDFLVKFGKLK